MYKGLKKNLKLALITCLLCSVAFLTLMSSSTWAWFINSDLYNAGSIATSNFSATLGFSKIPNNANDLNKNNAPKRNGPLLSSTPLLANNKTEKSDEKSNEEEIKDIHIITVGEEESGKYLIDVNSTGNIGGYCILTIASDDKVVKKIINVNHNEKVSFVVCTNKPVSVEISNLTWGEYKKYDELEETYYFGSYQIQYEPDVNRLPCDYKELSYIEATGEQYISDIVVDDEHQYEIINKHIEKVNISDEENPIMSDITIYESKVIDNDIIYYDEDGEKALLQLVPCQNIEGQIGLYDLINNKFYHSETKTEFIGGDYVYGYDGINHLNLEGEMEVQTVEYGVDKDSLLANCDYKLSGFNFGGYKCNDLILERDCTLSQLEELFNPRNDEKLIVKAIWNKNKIYIRNSDVDTSEYSFGDDLSTLFVQPEIDDCDFVGYYNDNDELLVSKENIDNEEVWKQIISTNPVTVLHPKFIERNVEPDIEE